jgi:AcrR family transcriptional regulator
MPRTQEANQRLREAQRAKILDGAKQAFARKGTAATMADVAAAAGVSQGLAYRYFASKEAIFRELVQQAAQSGIAILQRVQQMPGTPRERLNTLITKSIESMRNRLDTYQLSGMALRDEATPDDLRALLRQQTQMYQELLRQLIVEGQANGEVASGDPDQLVMVIMIFIDGLFISAVRSPEQFKKHFPDIQIVLRMLKP